MAKYNYREMKSQPNYGELVHEANRKIMNDTVIPFRERFGFGGLEKAVLKIEEKQLFGVLTLLDKNAVKIATFKVRHGIIEQVYLNSPIIDGHDYKPVSPYSLNFERSIVNDSVTWKNISKEERNA